jgi:hypothetical protein
VYENLQANLYDYVKFSRGGPQHVSTSGTILCEVENRQNENLALGFVVHCYPRPIDKTTFEKNPS